MGTITLNKPLLLTNQASSRRPASLGEMSHGDFVGRCGESALGPGRKFSGREEFLSGAKLSCDPLPTSRSATGNQHD